jgi:nitroreductase
MDMHRALLSRRTIHAFTSDPLPEDVLLRALEAAHHAPCHRLTWPWTFHLLGAETRATLLGLAIAEKERRGPLPDAQRDAITRAWLTPPGLIVVTSKRDARPDVDEENYAASCCAVQNLMLSLHADGWGTKWSTGGAMKSAATLPLLGMAAAEQRLVGQVWVGRAAAVPTIDRPAVELHLRRMP